MRLFPLKTWKKLGLLFRLFCNVLFLIGLFPTTANSVASHSRYKPEDSKKLLCTFIVSSVVLICSLCFDGVFFLHVHTLKTINLWLFLSCRICMCSKFSRWITLTLPVWLNGWALIYKLRGCGLNPIAVIQICIPFRRFHLLSSNYCKCTKLPMFKLEIKSWGCFN